MIQTEVREILRERCISLTMQRWKGGGGGAKTECVRVQDRDG